MVRLMTGWQLVLTADAEILVLQVNQKLRITSVEDFAFVTQVCPLLLVCVSNFCARQVHGSVQLDFALQYSYEAEDTHGNHFYAMRLYDLANFKEVCSLFRYVFAG